MDHLMLWPGAQWLDDDFVPYLAREDYLGVPFLEYLARYRQLEEFEHAYRLSANDFDCIFQTCFFFSLLQEIFGAHYSHSSYIKPAEHSAFQCRLVVTTRLLERNLRNWVRDVHTQKVEVRNAEKEHLRECFDRILPIFSRSANRLSHKVKVPSMHIPWPQNREIKAMVEHGGWCPFEARQAWRNFDHVSTVMLLRSTKRLKFDQRHQNCSIAKCNVAFVENENFFWKHATDECSCDQTFWFDAPELLKMLRRSETPVLKLTVNRDDDYITASLASADPSRGYVAVSHVWSDGLGNPNVNAVRMCQLRALSNRLFELSVSCGESKPDDNHFEVQVWLDTLCVPLKPEADRLLALSRMVHYYKRASRVLVLDSDIQSYEYDEKQLLLAGVIVFSSRWTWRLWTLQEAVMASELYFAFANTSVELSVFAAGEVNCEQMQRASFSSRVIFVDLFINSMRLRLQSGYHRPSNSEIQLEDIHHSVKNRLLSVISDEALCLANVMGFEVAIPELRSGDRMALFWRTVCEKGYLDQNIIFNPFPRLQQTGYRWAPSSLLFQNSPPVHDRLYFKRHAAAPKARYMTRGLGVKFPALFCHVHSTSVDNKTMFEALDHAAMKCCFFRDVRSGRWYYFGSDDYITFDFFGDETSCTLILQTAAFTPANSSKAVLAKHGEGRINHWPGDYLESMLVGRFRDFDPQNTEMLNAIVGSTEFPYKECVEDNYAISTRLWRDLADDRPKPALEIWMRSLHDVMRAGLYLDIIDWQSEPRTWVVG